MLAKTKDRDNLFDILQGLSGTMLSVASQIYSLAMEMEKPEEERQPGLTQETLDAYAEELTYSYNDYFEPVDKAMLLRVIKMAAALPQNSASPDWTRFLPHQVKRLSNG